MQGDEDNRLRVPKVGVTGLIRDVNKSNSAPHQKIKKQNSFFLGLQASMMKNNLAHHPRLESYLDMWTSTLCPNFKIVSFTFINVSV